MKDHISQPAGNGLPNAAQGAVGFVCFKGTLLVCAQLLVHQDLQVLLCQAAFQTVGPQHILVPEVVPPQGQGFALLLAELHEVAAG